MKTSTNGRLTKAAILKTLRAHEQEMRQFSVKRIGLFGSYASGRQTTSSDIDFVVEFERPTYDNFIGLIAYLQKLFKKRVEILTPDGVDSIRVEEVARSIRENVVYA